MTICQSVVYRRHAGREKYGQVVQSERFAKWLKKLKDDVARRQIRRRIDRIAAMDNFGDFASVGDGVSELRIHVGPGYRVYYARRGEEIVILLCGGDKDSQDRDIEKAKEMASGLD